MSRKGKLYIFGYSGHAYVVLDTALALKLSPEGYFEQVEKKKNPYALKYMGQETQFDFTRLDDHDVFFPALGKSELRKRLVEIAEDKNLSLSTLLHPAAIISSNSLIKYGTLVAPGAIVNSGVHIGKGCIINTGAIVEHECSIGDYSHIAPGAVLAGNVTTGKECFIGMNSSIKEGVQIGDRVIVGAGAVVLKDIPSDETWVGNPAYRFR
ncbi:acetyltransferase [Cryomorphaceae bacterium 1068]|nr:acetyltransferase [Cryomorphaceae bacterium 1068]